MSKAFKCDRCGDYYDKDFPVQDLSVVFRYGYTTNRRYDLCEKCGEELVKFMKGDKK